MAGIYIHIPFCKQACHYCDFHFSTNTTSQREMTDCLRQELELRRDYLEQESIETLYLGGGTPSLLTEEDLLSLLKTLADSYDLSSLSEVTLEANPDDLSPTKLRQLKTSGVNRLSIGIQSFDNAILKFLNRAHNSSLSVSSFSMARDAGFTNITIDLIYAIPGQDISVWRDNIERAIQLDPEHISAYSLTIEPRTAFGNWYSKGKLQQASEDQSARELELLVDLLSDAGYEQYEVSNFSKPGYHSQHNSNYWLQHKYLGVGPSAHSFNLHSRQFNVSNNYQYMRSLQGGVIPATVEPLTHEDRINEHILTRLRTRWGCDLEFLKTDFQYDLQVMHRSYLDRLQTNDLAIVNGSTLILTRKGLMLADKIASDLFFPAS